MRWAEQLRIRIQMLFRRKQAGSLLDDELRFHLEHQIAENVAAGMSPDEARHAALRAFGNPTDCATRRGSCGAGAVRSRCCATRGSVYERCCERRGLH